MSIHDAAGQAALDKVAAGDMAAAVEILKTHIQANLGGVISSKMFVDALAAVHGYLVEQDTKADFPRGWRDTVDYAAVEAQLLDDITWAVNAGIGWNPRMGAVWEAGKWQPRGRAESEPCGVCAIGARVLRIQALADEGDAENVALMAHSRDAQARGCGNDYQLAATSLSVSWYWAQALWHNVGRSDTEEPWPHPTTPDTWQLSRRLRAYADRLTKGAE